MAKETNIIPIQGINQGGLADSKWSGVANSVSKLVGYDLHSSPGILKVRQKLAKDSGDTVTEFVKHQVEVEYSSGVIYTYHFSSESGKIWQRTNTGVWSLADTLASYNSNDHSGGGGVACLGAYVYSGYIYWATERYLHRIKISTETLGDWDTYKNPYWQRLDEDQDQIGGGGFQYAVPATANTTATHIQTFTVTNDGLDGVMFQIYLKGTGDLHAIISDSEDAPIAMKTIPTADLANLTQYYWWFDQPIPNSKGQTYKIYFYQANGDTTLMSGSTSCEDLLLKIFTDIGDEYRPMLKQNLVLYIGCGAYVHQVEGEVFTRLALDLPFQSNIKCIGKYGTEILLGTKNSNVRHCTIYRWNTWSVSWSTDDDLSEYGVNAILQSDNANIVFVIAGREGNIYYYNGETLELYKKIPGEYSDSDYTTVHQDAVAQKGSIMMFGISNGANNPTEQGIYVLGRNSRNYPFVLDLSYPISERSSDEFVLSGIEIGSILISGNSVIVSWKHGDVYGVDVSDPDTKLEYAYFESRAILNGRYEAINLNEILVAYHDIPTDTSVNIELSKNYGDFSELDTMVDASRNMVVTTNEATYANIAQVKVKAVSNNNDAPEIENAAIILE